MTKLIYLSNSYLAKSNAIIIEERKDDLGLALILDQTIFYPQGGGQPSDTGIISGSNVFFNVDKVRLNENGEVLHYGEYEKGSFQSGLVQTEINIERRIVNAKVHSAGHLLDCAVTALGIKLIPTKGFHFPEGPYVEYDGILDNHNEWISPLEEKINELVNQNIKIDDYVLSSEEAAQKGVWAPPGKSARVVVFEGYEGCGCGGTHVSSSSEIGKMKIRKIKVKKGVTRIAYSIVV
jgi:Ser-tRNA(Ala) deacylase AlaX